MDVTTGTFLTYTDTSNWTYTDTSNWTYTDTANWTYTYTADPYTANISNNVTSSNTTVHRDESLARVEVFVQSVILVLAVLGNSIVLVALFLRRRSLTRMHVLMIHLSVADLFVAFCSVTPQLAWDVFKGGDFLCRLVKYMQIVAIYASSYVLLTTAIDRYLAICHPLLSHKLPSNVVQRLVLAAWSLSLLFSIPQLFIFSYKLNYLGLYDCWATFDPPWTLTLYITTFTCLVYIIPTLILVYCYSNICLAVWKSGKTNLKHGSTFSKKMAKNHPTSSHLRTTLDHENKVFAKDMNSDFRNHDTRKTKLGGTYDSACKFQTHNGRQKTVIFSDRLDDDIDDNITQSLEHLHDAKACSNSSNMNSKKSLLTRKTRLPNRQQECEVNSQIMSSNDCNGTSQTSLSPRKTRLPNHHREQESEGIAQISHVTKRSPTSCDLSGRSRCSRNGTSPISHMTKRTTTTGTSGSISRAKIKTIKLTMTVVICYLACWSPFFIAQMWAVYDVNAPFDGSAYTIILLLASLNSCTNPWIYLIFSDIFFTCFKELFARMPRK